MLRTYTALWMLIGLFAVLFSVVDLGTFRECSERQKVASECTGIIPTHLWNEPNGLYMRVGDGIVGAPRPLLQLARSYPTYAHKGPLIDDIRSTILCEKEEYMVGESVWIVHCFEELSPSAEVSVMGPKAVFDEYVDGRNMRPSPNNRFESYSGMVVNGPWADFNYDLTNYSFQTPGVYRIQWGRGAFGSNVLTIRVRK